MARKSASNISVSSPLPTAPVPLPFQQMVSFYKALQFAMEGKCLTRQEWNAPDTFICIHYGFLRLYKEDKQYHDLIVRDVDISATDWIVVPNPAGLTNTSTTP